MMTYYYTKQDEMLDYICWQHYGFSSGTVEVVLENNPGIAEYGNFLPAGVEVKLPMIQAPLKKSILKVWE